MKESFIPKRFKGKAWDIITRANIILEEYREEGYDLTLRQLYYQFVARDWFPEDMKWTWTGSKWVKDLVNGTKNAEPNYKALGWMISDARLAGYIDWDMMVDRARSTYKNRTWESPEARIRDAADSFQIRKWDDQDYHVEVMVEKQALEGILMPVCDELDIHFTSNKGYTSLSHLYETCKRLDRMRQEGKTVRLIYLGDHDPSGIDMTRDIFDRTAMFLRDEDGVDVTRVALNMDQVKTLNPPPNPAKTTDSRFASYRKKFGIISWELDAIEPRALAKLVTDCVKEVRDEEKWEAMCDKEEEMRKEIKESIGYKKVLEEREGYKRSCDSLQAGIVSANEDCRLALEMLEKADNRIVELLEKLKNKKK